MGSGSTTYPRCFELTETAMTGHSPFYIGHGFDPVLPIELEIPTWRILPWGSVTNTAELLAMRARQLQRRDEDLMEARDHLQRMRERGKEEFEERKNIRLSNIEVGFDS